MLMNVERGYGRLAERSEIHPKKKPPLESGKAQDP
jgi:hypothetical protein